MPEQHRCSAAEVAREEICRVLPGLLQRRLSLSADVWPPGAGEGDPQRPRWGAEVVRRDRSGEPYVVVHVPIVLGQAWHAVTLGLDRVLAVRRQGTGISGGL